MASECSPIGDCIIKDSASADLEKDRDAEFFPDDFKKYMLAELCWEKRHKEIWEWGPKERRDWVFWSRDDGKLLLPNSDFNFNRETATAFPKFTDRLKEMLEIILTRERSEEHRLLVQFWAYARTVEGRPLLKCKNEPFALRSFYRGLDIDGLCSYRKISEEYIIYLDDPIHVEISDERLGPIGRAFLNSSQESTPNVEYYPTKEYPLRNHALHCQLKSSCAAPLFQYYEHPYCIGVLEIVSNYQRCISYHDRSGSRITRPSAYLMPLSWFKEDVHYKDALNKIKDMFELVCKFHEIYLAQLWLPKSVLCKLTFHQPECNYNIPVFKYFSYGYGRDSSDQNFAMICDEQALRKGEGVVGRALKSPNLVYCTDITQFSIVEYPLAHYAQLLGLGGCGSFALCLKSIHTGDEVYVVEFILPANYEISEDIMRKILGTMIESFDTFKLASGDELTEEITIEVIDFHDGEKNESIQTSQTAKHLPLFGPSQDVGELDLPDQQLLYATKNGSNVVSAEKSNVDVTRILPGPEPLQNGDQMMQLDLSDQQLLDGANNESNVVGAEQSDNDFTRFLPLELPDQQLVDGANNERNVVGAEQSNIDVTRFSPGLEPLQNGGLDLGDQHLEDGANDGNNVVGAEQSNVDVTHSRKKGTRKEPKKGEKTTGTRIEITLQEIEQCSEMTLDAAAEKLKVSRSALKRVRESYGIKKWHPHEIKRVCRAGIGSKSLPCVYQTPKLNSDRSQTRPCDMVMQDNNSNNKVTIKAKYKKRNLKFQLSMPPRVEELQQEVAKRLDDMEAGTYDIQYEDVEDGDMISICCNDDLQGYVATCASKGVTSVVIFLSKNT